VQTPTVDESNENDDKDWMHGMIADIGMQYDLGSGDQHPPQKVYNFCRLLATLDEKVQDDIRLMAMKSNYNFSNQCYNNIVKFIIDLIPVKHNMTKDLYQFKKIVADLGMNYEKIDVCKKNCNVVMEGA
jgi:hypothetical protein